MNIDTNRFTSPSLIDRCGLINFKFRKQLKALCEFMENSEGTRHLMRGLNVEGVSSFYDTHSMSICVTTDYNENKVSKCSFNIEDVIFKYTNQ